ncbi:hypothetical protein [Bradyrhizobium sp. C9]|uniref:hypothetical protein n=1 Tax=Bradyrhizobium sp. C9 TaxID=142585 RepID=UPI000BE7F0B6|nr:hypothetical protein [Bradyrhizobium sp. C9]PDT77141.1 hypothetical protein CO675_11280 [Bradyrhizobium sp. C9]
MAFLGLGEARADSVVAPFTHNSPMLDHASVIGSHQDIHTLITPIPNGFKIHARYSNGSGSGAFMCSRTYFRTADHHLIVGSIQPFLVPFGNSTAVRDAENLVVLPAAVISTVAFVEIEQLSAGDDCLAKAKSE